MGGICFSLTGFVLIEYVLIEYVLIGENHHSSHLLHEPSLNQTIAAPKTPYYCYYHRDKVWRGGVEWSVERSIERGVARGHIDRVYYTELNIDRVVDVDVTYWT